METTLLEILKISIPAVIVMLTAVFAIRFYTNKEYNLKMLEIKLRGKETIDPLRLQACERMTLFLERISPQNLIPRVRQSDMTAKEMHFAMIHSIREEYEHNLAQQVYLSKETWESINLVKDDLIKTINLISAGQATDATGNDLSRAVLTYYMEEKGASPSQQALEIIRREVQERFG